MPDRPVPFICSIMPTCEHFSGQGKKALKTMVCEFNGRFYMEMFACFRKNFPHDGGV